MIDDKAPDAKPATEGIGQYESSLTRKVWDLYYESKDHWQPFLSFYDTAWKWVSGNHYKDTKKPSWQAKASVNHIFSALNSVAAIMTDGDPRLIALPMGPHDVPIAGVATKILASQSELNHLASKRYDHLLAVLMFGDATYKSVWNPRLRGGIGDVAITTLSPRLVWMDPSATSYADANYVIVRSNVSLGWLKREYGEEVCARVIPGVRDGSITVDRSPVYDGMDKASYQDRQVASTDGSRVDQVVVKGGEKSLMTGFGRDQMVTLLEFWCHEKDGIYVYYVANDVLVRGPIRHPLGHTMPFSMTKNWPKEGCSRGMSYIEQLIGMQKIINLLMNSMTDGVSSAGQRTVVAAHDADFDEKKYIPGKPNAVLKVTDIGKIKFEQGNSFDGKMLGLLDAFRFSFDAVSAIHDVTQGRRPSGVTAASAIAELQEAGQTQIRPKIREHVESLRRVGELGLMYAKMFYDQPRAIRIAGPSGAYEFITIGDFPSISSQDLQSVKLADIQRGEFDIEVQVGSGLPISRMRYIDLAMKFFQLGIVDDSEVLKMADWPDYEDIITRKRAAQAQAAQAQAAAATATGGGGGAGGLNMQGSPMGIDAGVGVGDLPSSPEAPK
jgi:hypothetical protein